MMGNRRNILNNIALIIISLIFFIIVLEIVLRLAKYDLFFGNNAWLEDENMIYKLKPGFQGFDTREQFSYRVNINSKGLRDFEYQYEKNNAYRILAIGDSFTFGVGVKLNKTFIKIIERLLNEKNVGRYEVINAGIPAYGTLHEYHFLIEEGLKYNPDLVMLIFTDNDVINNQYPTSSNPINNSPPSASRSMYFRSLTFINEKINNIKWKIKKEEMDYFNLSFIEDPELNKERWNLTESILTKINNELNKINTQFVIVSLPSIAELYYGKETIIEYGRGYSFYDDLLLFGKKYKVSIIDITPAFNNTTYEEGFIVGDGHFTEKGNILAAKKIYEELNKIINQKE